MKEREQSDEFREGLLAEMENGIHTRSFDSMQEEIPGDLFRLRDQILTGSVEKGLTVATKIVALDGNRLIGIGWRNERVDPKILQFLDRSSDGLRWITQHLRVSPGYNVFISVLEISAIEEARKRKASVMAATFIQGRESDGMPVFGIMWPGFFNHFGKSDYTKTGELRSKLVRRESENIGFMIADHFLEKVPLDSYIPL